MINEDSQNIVEPPLLNALSVKTEAFEKEIQTMDFPHV